MAIPLPEEIKTNLASLQAKLKNACTAKGIKWVSKENFHITILFLGEISEEQVAQLKNFLLDRTKALKMTNLQVAGLGYFGKPVAPRVLWAGVNGDLTQFVSFSADLKNFTSSISIATDDKPFSAHITLGRINEANVGRELISKMNALTKYEAGSFMTNCILLMQSALAPEGPTYHPIAEFKIA